MSPPSLLIVEDDPTLRSELTEYLAGQGFAVDGVEDVQAAEQKLQTPYDLMVLDLNLPDGSGVELCARLRPYVRSGIVICSGRSERDLRLSMLRNGADAYLVKPVDPEELAAVLTSVLRRVTPVPASPMLGAPPPPQMWRLDRAQQSLVAPTGRRVNLSAGEMLLMAAMFSQPDRVMERQQLLDAFDAGGMPMTGPRLDTMVSRLRNKVFNCSGAQLPLRANYGRGYVFAGHVMIL